MLEDQKVSKEVLIDHTARQSRLEFASMLETIAEKLKTEGAFSMVEGTKEILVAPGEEVKVGYSYKTKGDKHAFEIECKWYEDQPEVDKLSIS